MAWAPRPAPTGPQELQPIAMPGQAALRAALHPAPGDALYFVARGDGSSEFSRTLDEHNRAVNRYQRGGK